MRKMKCIKDVAFKSYSNLHEHICKGGVLNIFELNYLRAL
jgi:hypothetical protein